MTTERIPLVQPRNIWWWIMVVPLCVLPFTLLKDALSIYEAIDISATMLVAVLTAGVGGVTLWLLSRSPLCPKPALPLLMTAVLWGAIVAPNSSSLVSLSLGKLTYFFGTDIFEASFGAAFSEEALKLLGVYVVTTLARPSIKHPGQFLVLGFAVGLGFTLIEDVLYASSPALVPTTTDIEGLTQGWILRFLAGPLTHSFYTAIAAWGLGLFLYTKRLRALWWIALPIALHFLVNTAVPFDAIVPPQDVPLFFELYPRVNWLAAAGVLGWIWQRVERGFLDAVAQGAFDEPSRTQPAVLEGGEQGGG